jgi:hypothetical protein
METLNNIQTAYKLKEDEFDFSSVDNIVAEEILVLKNGKAIANYTDHESVTYNDLDGLLKAHKTELSDYSESKTLADFWNSKTEIKIEGE